MMTCTLCHGEMVVQFALGQFSDSPRKSVTMLCPRCHGSGLVPTSEEVVRQERHDRALQAAFARD